MNELVTPRAESAGRSRVARQTARVVAIEALGPLTILGGVVWAFAQPYRVTFFYPDGKGFWDWAVQPPLLVVLVGLLFSALRRPRARRGPGAGATRHAEMLPRAEIAHWLFAAGFLFFGLVLLAEAIIGQAVFRSRPWRAYLWPSLALFAGVWLWVIVVFSTFSTLHLVAHSVWAQAATAAGAVSSPACAAGSTRQYWSLVTAGALFVSGRSFLVHEQNGWLFARSAFLHHLIGWTLVARIGVPARRRASARAARRGRTGSR